MASLALTRLDQVEAAFEEAKQARAFGPHVWQAHTRLAIAAVDIQRVDVALEATSAALELAPNEPAVHYTHGLVLYAAGRYAEAAAAYERVLSTDPHHVGALNELGRLRLANRDLGAAANQFVTALRTEPTELVGRFNLDLTLRWFLARSAWALTVIAVVAARVGVAAGGLGHTYTARLLVAGVALAGLIVLYLYIRRFLNTLTPDLRRYLFRTLRKPAPRTATALQCVAVVAILAIALPLRPAVYLAFAVIPCALTARLILWRERRQLMASGAA